MNYKTIINQVNSIIDESIPLVSNLSNVSSILNQLEDINWVGFYLVMNNKLYLGPFQGEVACTTIEYGKGVCGASFKEKRTIIIFKKIKSTNKKYPRRFDEIKAKPL